MRWLLLLFTLLAMTAQGRGDDRGEYDINLNSNQASSSSESYGAGGQASASNDGVSVGGDDHDNRFFSFATTFPQAHGCLGGVQGGGAGSSSGGFFGIHFINENCWTSALAEAEANVEVRSLLKCAGDIFRDAIAFEQTENKQRYCVDFMVENYKAQIENAREIVDEAIKSGQMVPSGSDVMLAANVTEEQLEAITDETKAQIEDLKKRTLAAEKRAAAAQAQLKAMQTVDTTKREKLIELQKQLRQENATIPSATE